MIIQRRSGVHGILLGACAFLCLPEFARPGDIKTFAGSRPTGARQYENDATDSHVRASESWKINLTDYVKGWPLYSDPSPGKGKKPRVYFLEQTGKIVEADPFVFPKETTVRINRLTLPGKGTFDVSASIRDVDADIQRVQEVLKAKESQVVDGRLTTHRTGNTQGTVSSQGRMVGGDSTINLNTVETETTEVDLGPRGEVEFLRRKLADLLARKTALTVLAKNLVPKQADNQPRKEDAVSKLTELKELKDKGLITDQEYQSKRKVVVDQLGK